MALNLLRRRWHKITAIIITVLVAIVLILSLFVNSYWSPILSSKVKDVVLKSSDGLYKADFSSAELHVLRGTIEIYNITFKPDTAVYNLRKKQNLAPNNLVELTVKRLTLNHIHPFKLYFQHKLEIGEVLLEEPVVNISYQLNHKKDTLLKNKQTAWQKISKTLRSIHIGSILLGDIKLKYEDYSGNKLSVSEFKEMNLSATDLLIDSTTQKDTSRLLYCRDIIAELNNYSSQSPNGLYTYKFNHLKLSTRESRLNIEGLSLTPINTDAFFARSEKNKYTMRLDSLRLNHFDFLNYHKYRHITASSLYLSRGSIEVYGNPRHAKPTSDRVVTFPNVGLYNINADMEVDTALLQHIDVFYSEFNEKSNKTGTISFNNTGGRFLNITTRPVKLQKNNICTVDLNSMFMNQGKLNIGFAFNLTDERHSFTYKGHLGAMNLKILNPALRPLSMIKINNGTLKQFDFDISADRSTSRGKITLLYNKLTVSLLKEDTVLNNLHARTFESLYANVFIIKHDNPDAPGVEPRSSYVTERRDSESPFFKFAWQTLLSGIKPAVGLNKKKIDETAALIQQQKTYLADRKVKKQQRILRREVRRKKRADKKLGLVN